MMHLGEAPSPNHWLQEASERRDGPAILAVWGDDTASSDFQLGSRETGWHQHARGQLFCVEDGLVQVETPHGAWVMPPHRAGWIPPDVPHRARLSGAHRGWNVLITPDLAVELPLTPCVLAVNPLLRALVDRATRWLHQAELDVAQLRLQAVLLDELQQAPQEALHLPMPQDRRLLKIVNALLLRLEDTRTLEAWAQWAGLSARTITRLFQQETGLSFAQWRQQARLVQALERLSNGERVAQVADALGYATPSAFISMFQRAFGVTPARWFATR